ncbi:hypothetical protein ACIQVE_29355 [Pseudomonas sp. NPDC098747]|uniref:hypothetical protein n=1 Tax=Pseudomonas sp. NPDC098747 TaxID=3364487 RepID=UPI00383A9FC4
MIDEEITQAEMHQDGHAPMHSHKHKHEGEEMSQGIDLQQLGGGFGGGMGGGGLVAGLVLGALLRNGGLGGREGEGCVTPSNLVDVTTLSKLGEIQAQIPQVTAAIENSTLTQTLGLQGTLGSLALGIQQAFANTKDTVQATSALTLAGISGVNQNVSESACEIKQAINNDGDRTRALINSIDRDNLNRLLTSKDNELIELRHASSRASDRHGIEITMINNQNQLQAQAQAQANVLGQLVHVMTECNQIARATNTNLIVGNTGATTTGAQTASPVNVKA